MQDLPAPALRTQRVLAAAVALSFVFLLGSAVLVWIISRAAEAADERVVHTLEVKQRIEDILTIVTAAESSQRGYILTRAPALLDSFVGARSVAPQRVAELRTLVADNPSQVTRVDELSAAIEARFAAMETTLRFANEGRMDDAARGITQSGERLMEQFRQRIAALDRAENALLVARQQAAATTRERFVRAVAVMLVTCGVLALFALTSVRRNLRIVELSRQALHEQNRWLEERVRARTLELEQAAEVTMRERNRAESLLTDVNHRVGNNLALVSSFLMMQQRAVRHPEAARALDAARARVQAIASAHRKLRLGADFATVRANEVLTAVVDDISAGLPPGEAIKIHCEVAPLEINARDAVSLGVLTSELVMNAVKHAFGAGDGGRVSVKFAKPQAAAPFIEVTDDGVGWHDKQNQENSSLGCKIIDMVTRQFGGRLQRAPLQPSEQRPGTRIRIELDKLQLVEPAS